MSRTIDLDLITADEAAALLRISRAQVYQLALERKLPHVRIGRSVKFDRPTLLRWVAQQLEESVLAVPAPGKSDVVHRLPSGRSRDGSPPALPAVAWGARPK